MEINWVIVVLLVIFALILILFIVRQNLKDKRELEVFLNENEIPPEEDEDEPNNIQ